jgi:hypothetical protein
MGSSATFVLQTFPHQHQCRCGPYFTFSSFRIPFSRVSTFSIIQNTHNASRILFTTCSYSGKVVRTAGVLVASCPGKSTNISSFSVILSAKIVGNISSVFIEYEERVRELQKVPRFSHGRRMLRTDGALNRAFFYSLFNDHLPLITCSPVIIIRLEF